MKILEYDIIVAGGDTAGSPAAIAAARRGRRLQNLRHTESACGAKE